MVSGDGRRYVPMTDLETFADAGITLVNGGLGAPSGIDAGQQQNDHKTLVTEYRSSPGVSGLPISRAPRETLES